MLIDGMLRRRGLRRGRGLSFTRPSRGRWAWRVPRPRRQSGRWSSRRGSPTTPNTRSRGPRSGGLTSPTATWSTSTSSCTYRPFGHRALAELRARRRDGLGARGSAHPRDTLPGRVRARRRHPDPARHGQAAPRAGVFAHGQAEVVARNIARIVAGHERPRSASTATARASSRQAAGRPGTAPATSTPSRALR